MDLVTIDEFGNASEAYLLQNYLQANGIRAYISGGVDGGFAAFGAILQVADSDKEKAVDLIQKVKRSGKPTH